MIPAQPYPATGRADVDIATRIDRNCRDATGCVEACAKHRTAEIRDFIFERKGADEFPYRRRILARSGGARPRRGTFEIAPLIDCFQVAVLGHPELHSSTILKESRALDAVLGRGHGGIFD